MWALRTGAGRYVDKQSELRFDPVIIYFFDHFGTSQFNFSITKQLYAQIDAVHHSLFLQVGLLKL